MALRSNQVVLKPYSAVWYLSALNGRCHWFIRRFGLRSTIDIPSFKFRVLVKLFWVGLKMLAFSQLPRGVKDATQIWAYIKTFPVNKISPRIMKWDPLATASALRSWPNLLQQLLPGRRWLAPLIPPPPAPKQQREDKNGESRFGQDVQRVNDWTNFFSLRIKQMNLKAKVVGDSLDPFK